MENKICQSCNIQNDSLANFCFQCGKAFLKPCPSCKHPNSEKAFFCIECGGKLADENPGFDDSSKTIIQDNTPLITPNSEDSPLDKKLIVSLIYIDLKGFFEITKKLYQKQAEFLKAYLPKEIKNCIEDYNGYIYKGKKDAILAFFGVPAPVSDDALRAVSAALTIQEKVFEISETLKKEHKINLNIAIAIHTAKISLKRAQNVFKVSGNAIKVVKELQNKCPAGKIICSENCYRVVCNDFSFINKKTIQLKSTASKILIYQIKGHFESQMILRPPEFKGKRIPFIGRGQDLELLKNSWTDCIENNKQQLFYVGGDEGIGKSALVFQFDEWLNFLKDPSFKLELKLTPRSGKTAEAFFEAFIRKIIDLRQGDSHLVVQQKIKDHLNLRLIQGPKNLGYPLSEKQLVSREKFCQEAEIFFGYMIGCVKENHPLIQEYSGNNSILWQKITFTILNYLTKLEQVYPLFILIENCHFISEETLNSILPLVSNSKNNRFFIVFVGKKPFNQELIEDFKRISKFQSILLNPLTKTEIKTILEHLFKPLKNKNKFPQDVIIERANGNPYFLYELAHLLCDRGLILNTDKGFVYQGEKNQEISFSDSIQIILQSRIESLSSTAKQILCRASVIGFNFWQRILLEPGFDRSFLEELLIKKLIVPVSHSQIPQEKEYAFSSKELQKICYDDLSESEKRRTHKEVAGWLQSIDTSNCLELLVNFANHQKGAGLLTECFDTFYEAGDKAFYKSNYYEATKLYEEAENIKLFNENFPTKQKKDQRIADIAIRFHYLQNYFRALQYIGKTEKLRELCNKYIYILENAKRRPGDFTKSFKQKRDEFLRLIWKDLLKVNFHEQEWIDKAQHMKIRTLLGDTTKAPLSHGQVEIGFILSQHLWAGGKFLYIYKKQIEDFYDNLKEHLKSEIFKDKRLKSELLISLAFYQYKVLNKLEKALRFSASAAEISLNKLGLFSQTNSLIGFCIFLGISDQHKSIAQILKYLIGQQENSQIQFKLSVILNNQAEAYLLMGHFRPALKVYEKALPLTQALDDTKSDILSTSTIIRLNLNGADNEVEKKLDSVKEISKNSDYFHHRWLRSKALCHWKNRDNINNAEKAIKEAFSVISNNPIENIITEMVFLQILKEAKDPRLSKEEKRVAKYVNKNPETKKLWSHYTETGTSLPAQKAEKDDVEFKAFSKDELNQLIHNYLE